MIVLSFTLVIVHNARLLSAVAARGKGNRYSVAGSSAGTAAAVLAGVAMGDRIGGLGQLFYLVAVCMALFAVLALLAARIPRLAPALKMGVAYPLANRFRTGMTIAMFSLVIFSITMMGIINASILKMFSTDEAKGGWDIQVATNPNNPVDDLAAELRTEGSFDPSVITASGKVTQYDDNSRRRGSGRESVGELPNHCRRRHLLFRFPHGARGPSDGYRMPRPFSMRSARNSTLPWWTRRSSRNPAWVAFRCTST
jgi:hypothetical protein